MYIKAVTLIFISGRGSTISSAKEGKSGFIYNLVNVRAFHASMLIFKEIFRCSYFAGVLRTK